MLLEFICWLGLSVSRRQNRSAGLNSLLDLDSNIAGACVKYGRSKKMAGFLGAVDRAQH